MKICPRCSAEVAANLKACPKCGLSVVKFDAFAEKLADLSYGKPAGDAFSAKMTKEEKKAAKLAKKEQKKQQKKEKKIRESKSDTDFTVYALNNKNGIRAKRYENTFSGRRQRAKDSKKYPEFTIDPATKEFNIDTSDVEIVGEKTGKLIEEQHQSYSVKKSRGDYYPQRIKWWELYKLADRHFARRKIKKQISAASKIKPSFISKPKLLTLAILFGWMGAQNFYVKNYKKGIFSLITLVLWIGIVSLAKYVPFFASIQLSIGGFAGFLNVLVWVSDIFNIAFDSFKYRMQKEAFLFNLNFNTRAKLGEKYYDLELYKKPWWTRAKVWFGRRKREHEQAKHSRRQYKIEKEKQKAERASEQSKIDAEIARAEKMQSETIGKTEEQIEAERLAKLRSEVLDSETIKNINSFDGGKTISPASSEPKAQKSVKNQTSNSPKQKQAKVKVKSKNKKNK